jgi:uncharacterized membrane protein
MLLAVASLVLAILVQASSRIYTLHSSVFDLGIFESLLFSMADENQWQLAFTSHAHWFAFIYSPIFKAVSRDFVPYVLVSIQALLLVSPIIWLYRTYGCVIALCYITYYPVWANALFDFHFDHLAVPLLFGFYWGLIRGKLAISVLSASLLMLVKEPFALQSVACGILLIVLAFKDSSLRCLSEDIGRRAKLVTGGFWLIISGSLYFYFSSNVLLPYFTAGEWPGIIGGGGFSWLGDSVTEVFASLITKPHQILWDIVRTPQKLQYLFVIFGLLCFIPFFAPMLLIPALPILGVSMLSRFQNYYDYNTHYSAGLIIPVFFAFIYGMPRASSISRKALLAIKEKFRFSIMANAEITGNGKSYREAFSFDGSWNFNNAFVALVLIWVLMGHMLLSFSPVSRLFWSEKVWSYGFSAYLPDARDRMIREAISQYIPRQPDTVISSQNSLNSEVLSNRKIISAFPAGVTGPINKEDWTSRDLGGLWRYAMTGERPQSGQTSHYAEYVLLDLNRPLFVLDKGCEWIYGRCRDKELEMKFHEILGYVRSSHDLVFENDGFMIFKK